MIIFRLPCSSGSGRDLDSAYQKPLCHFATEFLGGQKQNLNLHVSGPDQMRGNIPLEPAAVAAPSYSATLFMEQ